MHRLFHWLSIIHVSQICGPRVMNRHSVNCWVESRRICAWLCLVAHERQKQITQMIFQKPCFITENGHQQFNSLGSCCCCSTSVVFCLFWYICLVIVEWLFSEHGISVSDRNLFRETYWQIGGEKKQHPLLFVVELKISNFEFSLYWKALRPIDGACVFVIFRFSRAGKDILGKFFTTCRLEHPPNNSPKVYQWNPYKVEQGGFSLVSNGTCWNNYGPEKNIRSIVDLDIHWSFEGSSPIDSAQLW